MEKFLEQYAANLAAAIKEGRITVAELMLKCEFCPLREACGKAADEGDNRSCEQFIWAEG